MVNRPMDPMTELQNAFSVLFKNWILALPTAIASLATAIFIVVVVGAVTASIVGVGVMGNGVTTSSGALRPGIGGLIAAGGATFIIGIVVLGLLALLAQAIVIAGAERVWHGQPADLAGGAGRAFSKLPPLILLFILGAIVFMICAIIIVIGWIAAIVLAFLFMYTVPAIIVGNEGVMQALGTSSRIVRANVGPSALAFVACLVVGIVGGIVSRLFLHIPVLGYIVYLVIGGFTSAYAALVIVRFYDVLRGAAPVTPAVTSGPTI